jgi:hypothetical protein
MIGPPEFTVTHLWWNVNIARRPEWVQVLDVNVSTGRQVVGAITYGASVVEGVCGALILYREVPELLWGSWYRCEQSDVCLGCY